MRDSNTESFRGCREPEDHHRTCLDAHRAFAFEHARVRSKESDGDHKANIMKLSDGLFLESVRRSPGISRVSYEKR